MSGKEKVQVKHGVCYGYIRASTEDQETTIDAQMDQIKALYQLKFKPAGFTWGGYFIDSGLSGGVALSNRPEGNKMCRAVEPGDAVLMQKLDRGWRNTADCVKTVEVWIKQEVRLAFCTLDIDTGTASGQFLLTILAGAAQLERAMVSERMLHFQAQRRKEGRPYCRMAPYGFRVVGPSGNKRFADFPEQRTIGRLFIKWLEGGWSLQQIVNHCQGKGIVHPLYGSKFCKATVRKWAMAERDMQIKEGTRKS